MKDFSEELTVAALVVLAMTAVIVLGAEGKDIAIAVGAGLVGYLTKANKGGTP